MQTRLPGHRPHRPSSTVAAALVASAVLTTAGCAMPRIEGRAESERVVSDCERAYYAAAALEAALPHPFVLRSLTAADAAAQWLDVAVDCPSRFGEGVTNAARLISRYAAGDTDDTALIAATDVWSSLTGDASGTAEPADSSASASDDDTAAASDAGESPSDADASADTTDTITGMPTASLAAMALAEDRAGFILQIMAARGDIQDAAATMNAAQPLPASPPSIDERLYRHWHRPHHGRALLDSIEK